MTWLMATGDFTTAGGMDRANLALAARLAASGRDVHLVAHRVASSLATRPGVQVRRVARPFHAHLLGAPLLASAASHAARRLGPGAAVLMNGGNGALGVPTWIHFLHAAYEPEVAVSVRTRISASLGRRYYLSRERAAITRAPLIICNSLATADAVVRSYGVPLHRLQVVYYGSDPDIFAPASLETRREAKHTLGLDTGGLAAAFIGALGDRRKGFDLVFDAWAQLSASGGWDVDLLIAGGGGEREAWIARAAAAGLQGSMRFVGFTSDVPRLLAAADVLVHPARYEAYGLGVHEALCCGVPAIVTASAGVVERMPPALAPLVLPDPPTRAALVQALRTWREAPETWRSAAAAVGAALRARTWDAMADDITAVVEAAA